MLRTVLVTSYVLALPVVVTAQTRVDCDARDSPRSLTESMRRPRVLTESRAVRQPVAIDRSPLTRYACHRAKRLTWRWPCLSDARATSSPWKSPTGIVANQYDWRLDSGNPSTSDGGNNVGTDTQGTAKTRGRWAWPQPPVLSYVCRDGRSYRRSRWTRPHGTEPVRRSA